MFLINLVFVLVENCIYFAYRFRPAAFSQTISWASARLLRNTLQALLFFLSFTACVGAYLAFRCRLFLLVLYSALLLIYFCCASLHEHLYDKLQNA